MSIQNANIPIGAYRVPVARGTVKLAQWEVAVEAIAGLATTVYNSVSSGGPKTSSDPTYNVEQPILTFLQTNIVDQPQIRQALNNIIAADYQANPSHWAWTSRYGGTLQQMVSLHLPSNWSGKPEAVNASSPIYFDPIAIWESFDDERPATYPYRNYVSVSASQWIADAQAYQALMTAFLQQMNGYIQANPNSASTILTQGSAAIQKIVGSASQSIPSSQGITTASLSAGLPMLLILGAAAYVVFGRHKERA